MKFHHHPVLLSSLALLMLAGCAERSGYPSLNPRPIELRSQAMLGEPAPVAAQMSASQPKVVARINSFVAEAQQAATAFDRILATEESTIRSGMHAAMGSEDWVTAQVALSRVERERGPVQAALAGLDAESRTMMTNGASADQAALDASIARVEAIDQAQSDALKPFITLR